MLEVLLVTFPFFALVGCGYAAARWRLLALEAIPGLNSFVLYFALPCLLFRFGASTPIAQMLDPALFFTYMFCAVLMVAFIVALSLGQHLGWNDSAFGALVGAFPNTGYMGVPLLVALLGPGAVGPAIVTILVDLLVTSSLCVALSRMDSMGSHGFRVAGMAALKGVAANPMPWAIVAGALTSALGLTLAQPVQQTLGLLADAASPVALFTIGAVLARSGLLAVQGHQEAPVWRNVLPVAAFKLLLHPLLVLLIGLAAIELGVPLDRFALHVAVLVAALPSASNVAMLAERFGADSGRVARIIMVSTAAAFLTFSAAVTLLR